MAVESEVDRLLRERQQQRGTPAAAAPSPAPPGEGAMSLPRTSLDLTKKNGERWSFPYGLMAAVYFDPAKNTIVIRYSFHIVTIRGRSLLGLYEQIAAQSCGKIEESSGNAAAMSGDGVPVVSGIEVQDPT